RLLCSADAALARVPGPHRHEPGAALSAAQAGPMRAFLDSALPVPAAGAEMSALDLIAPALSLTTALTALLLGCLTLVEDDLGSFAPVMLVVLALVVQLLFVEMYRQHAVMDFKLLALALLSFAGVAALYLLPTYLTGWQFNAVIHRSFFAAAWLLAA